MSVNICYHVSNINPYSTFKTQTPNALKDKKISYEIEKFQIKKQLCNVPPQLSLQFGSIIFLRF